MHRLGWILIVGFALALAGCAGGGSGGEASASGGSKAAASEAPPKSVPPPAGSRLAKVKLDMPPAEVRELIGAATSENTYQTGKAFIPYYGSVTSDTQRTEWNYKGEGRVVFGINKWSGKQKVIRIDYDPTEDGN